MPIRGSIGEMQLDYPRIWPYAIAGLAVLGGAGAASRGIAPSMVRSPLTVALIFAVVGYYVCYYAVVLWKSKRISSEDLEAVPTPNAASG